MQSISIEESKTAACSLKVQCGDGSWKRLHSLHDPEAEAVAIVDAFPFDGKGILVVLGMGLGYHVAELCRRYADADIVVVEAVPEIRDLCERHGKSAEFADRVRFIVGNSHRDAVEAISRHHAKAGLPPIAVFPFAPEVAAFPDYYGPIRASLERTASFRLWERLRYRKFKGEELTVALFDFGYFLTEEIARAVKALGHRVVRVPGKKDESCGSLLGRAMETVASRKPDFFLTVNHLGFDEDGILTDLFRAIEMPAAIWYVDSPGLIVRAFVKNASPYSSVFLWDEGYLEEMGSLGFENAWPLPLASDDTIFRPMNVSFPTRKKFGAAVGFAGNSMVVRARDQLRKVPSELHTAVERMAQRLFMTRNLPFAEVVKTAVESTELEAFESLGNKEKAELEAAVLWRATLLYRLSCLRELYEFRPCIMGDAGWKGLLNGNFRLGPQINYYQDLPLFYNACAVNFNATSVQMGKAVNQRVFDVPACGAFLLTDHQKSIEGLFEVGKEVVTYKDRGEIADLAGFYLRDSAAREAVAKKGRARILGEHTYRHRIDSIIRRLRKIYG